MMVDDGERNRIVVDERVVAPSRKEEVNGATIRSSMDGLRMDHGGYETDHGAHKERRDGPHSFIRAAVWNPSV